jgi:hypothetical protein
MQLLHCTLYQRQERSRRPQDILNELQELAGQGYVEVPCWVKTLILTGRVWAKIPTLPICWLQLTGSKAAAHKIYYFPSKRLSDKLIDTIAGGLNYANTSMSLYRWQQCSITQDERGYTREHIWNWLPKCAAEYLEWLLPVTYRWFSRGK